MSMDKAIAQQIIGRVEELRTHLGHNKSRFSAEMGMKAQTYNNFIGAQGSKPNVELIHGCVERWGANAHWLLTGTGPMLQNGLPPELRDAVEERLLACERALGLKPYPAPDLTQMDPETAAPLRADERLESPPHQPGR
jgi:hypothetical protein